jgi:hypothetical protein
MTTPAKFVQLREALPEEFTDTDAAPAADTDWTPLPGHPLAAIFPMMSDEQLKAHADDIKDNGQQVPILTYESKVLDGRNTQAACKIAGVVPRYEEWRGNGSPVSVVLSRNAHRRQLTDAQRAVSAARAKAAFEEEARQRRDANLLQKKGSTDGLNSGHRSEGRSAELAARALQVSRDSVNKAAKMLKHASPDLVFSVESGSISLDAGMLLATLPVVEQRRTLSGGTRQVQLRVKELRDAAKRPKEAKKQRVGDHANGSDKSDDTKPSNAETSTQPTATQRTDTTTTTTSADGAATMCTTRTSSTTMTPPDTERAGDATAESSTSPTAAPTSPCDDSSGEAETTGSDDESAEQTAQGMTPEEFHVAFRAMRGFLRKYPKVAEKVIATFTSDLRKSTGRAA